MFLRASNLVSPTRKEFDPAKQLVRQDIRRFKNAVVVDIKWSKTIQFAERILQVPLLPVADQDICPVTWIVWMYQTFPAKATDPAFAVPESGKMVPVSYSQLHTKLQNWSKKLNLTHLRLTPHCLRKGGCTYAHNVNIEAEAVQLIGDWASSAYKRYYTWSFRKRFQALRAMAAQAPLHAKKSYMLPL